MADLSHEQFVIHIGYVLKAVEKIESHLDTLNGRTRIVENDVAVLKSQVESATQAAAAAGQTGSDRTARMTGISGILAAAGALIWQWLQRP
jgi:hypothetical protein